MLARLGRWPARLAAAFFIAFAGFQLALATGAPWGRLAWGGSNETLPAPLRAASLGSCLFLSLAALVMLIRAGDLGARLPQRPFWWINLFLAVQLALNTVANLASASVAERMVMAPASALGCILCGVALLRRPAQRFT